MRKQLFALMCLLSILCGSHLVMAATVETIHLDGATGSSNPSCKVLSTTTSGLTLELQVPVLDKEDLQLGDEEFQVLSIPGGGFRGETGEAALPTYTRLVAIPDDVGVVAHVTGHQKTNLAGFHLAPRQPTSGEEFVKNSNYYTQQGMGEEALVQVGEPALMRGMRLVPITFQPVRYDPAKGEVEVTQQMTVELAFEGSNQVNNKSGDTYFIPESFDALYHDTIVNYDPQGAMVGPGSYLIICPDNASIINELTPLVNWRKRQGYNTVLATTAETGSLNYQIKNYIQNAYNNWETPLEFVCLVGDATGSYSLPTYFEGLSGYNGEGDHYYTNLQGGDVLSDIHIGRLSHRSPSELGIMVDKIVNYESDPYVSSDPGWFTRATLCADPSSSGYSCIFISQWAKNQLLDLSYTQIDTIWSGNYASEMQSSLNQGGTIFTYRGYLNMSGYSTGHIDALSNGRELHFAIVLTCGTGSFSDDSHARSEAFLRSANGGGVAAIGLATWGTHTRYNNCLYNGVVEGVLNMDDHRTGPAQTRGKLEMYLNYQSAEPDEVEIWSVWTNLMGDPATDIYTGYPEDIMVSHPATIAVGASSVAIDVEDGAGMPLEGARVALYKANEILITGYSDGTGRVLLPLDSHTAGELLVTVTKHNGMPYLGSVVIGTATTYLTSGGISIDDDNVGVSNGNGDGQANPGEIIELGVELQNLGTATAATSSAQLSSDDPYVTIVSNQQSYGDLGPGSSAWQSFTIELDQAAPGNRDIRFTLAASSGSGSWDNLVDLTVVGGACSSYNNDFSFNGGGAYPNPGESGTLTIDLVNQGNANIASATATLVSESPWVTVTDADGTYGAMAVGGISGNSGDPFAIAVTGDCYNGHMANFKVALEYATGAADTAEFQMNIGSRSVTDPVGPDHHGYYAFDNTDVSYAFAPTYDWMEIDPDLGGSGTSLGISDNGTYQDETVVYDLPFTFKFYGEDFDKISVCSNGWLAMGATYLPMYRNWTIPNAGGPDNLVAVFWDNLYMNSNSDILTWYDAANHLLVVEWSRMLNDMNGSLETFQAILYDPAHHVTDTGDGRIVYQYSTVNQVDWKNGYATVGIQNVDHSTGLLYTYFNRYAPGAATLSAGRAIAFQATLAQPQGYLEGDVTNVSGGGSPIAGAMITVVESGRTMMTQETGHYYGSTPGGIFTVRVEHESFLTETVYDVEIVVDAVTQLNFALQDILGPYLSNVTVHPGTDDTVGPYEIQVNITDYSPIDQMHFYYTSSQDGGRAHELPLQLLDAGSGLYKAEIPGQPLGTLVQYWLVSNDVAGNASASPANAPWDNYSFMVDQAEIIFSDDMESNQGWTVGDTGDDASSGIWARVDPNGVWEGGTEVQPEDDATPDPGVMCWITGNDPPGSTQGFDDVDGGKTTLLSPWFDLSSYQSVSTSYKRWYTNDTGNAPNEDYWVVQATENGSDWVNIEFNNLSNRSWHSVSEHLESYIDLTSSVRMKFIASDENAGSVVEAGLDDFALLGTNLVSDQADPTVTITDPDGGESVPRNQVYEIQWNAADDIGVVRTTILFSSDSGNSYPDTIATGALDSILVWDVPDFESPTCRIKIVVQDALLNEASDESDTDFALTGAVDVGDLPVHRLALEQNRPNPFNPRTEIRFSLPADQQVTLRVYDIEGRLVRTLVDERRNAGPHTVIWGGTDQADARVSSGLYFYRLSTGDGQIITRKMLLVK